MARLGALLLPRRPPGHHLAHPAPRQCDDAQVPAGAPLERPVGVGQQARPHDRPRGQRRRDQHDGASDALRSAAPHRASDQAVQRVRQGAQARVGPCDRRTARARERGESVRPVVVRPQPTSGPSRFQKRILTPAQLRLGLTPCRRNGSVRCRQPFDSADVRQSRKPIFLAMRSQAVGSASVSTRPSSRRPTHRPASAFVAAPRASRRRSTSRGGPTTRLWSFCAAGAAAGSTVHSCVGNRRESG